MLTKKKVPFNAQSLIREKNACYVLITCGEPEEDGKMHVEMTYEGDACLAAYLIESAQDFIGNHDDESLLHS